MKYVKKFENNIVYPSYWKVKTSSPEFEISLNMIGITKSDIDSFINNTIIINNFDYVYIGKSSFGFVSWDPLKIDNYCEAFEEGGYVYKGEIKIRKEDIEEYNLNKDTKKYNL